MRRLEQLGPYRIIERLGVGGMAEVFLARVHGAEGFQRDCVLKMLHPRLGKDPSFGRMLVEEARLTAYLRHANVVAVHDLGKEGDIVYVVMEYVEGSDLHSLIASLARRELPFPQDIAAFIARETCAGLHYAHTRRDEQGKLLNLVHRDISPHNILISHQGEVKLIDFGVAKIENALREQTRAGIIKGKFGYMSPEQAWDTPLDGRSDIFAVGICLYEMLTGRSLYGQVEDPLAMIHKVRKADIVPASTFRTDLDPEFEGILARALAPEKDDRYPTALEFQKELTAFLGNIAPRLTPYDVGQFLVNIAEDRDTTLRRNLLTPDPTNPEVSIHETTQPMAKTGDGSRDDIAVEDEDLGWGQTSIFREDSLPQSKKVSSKGAKAERVTRALPTQGTPPENGRPGLSKPAKTRPAKTRPEAMRASASLQPTLPPRNLFPASPNDLAAPLSAHPPEDEQEYSEDALVALWGQMRTYPLASAVAIGLFLLIVLLFSLRYVF